MVSATSDLMLENAKFEKVAEGSSKSDDVIGVYEGVIQKMDKPNKNDRVYTEEFWQNVFNSESNQGRLNEGLMMGQLGHPPEGVGVDLEKVSHFVSDLWVSEEDDDLIEGRIHVLGEPTQGAKLDTYLSAGIGLGISSRAAVDHYREGKKEMIVDGELYGFDFVEDPSVVEAKGFETAEETKDGIVDPSSVESLEEFESQARESKTDSNKLTVVMEAVKETKDLDSMTEENDQTEDENTSQEDSQMGEADLESIEEVEAEAILENHPDLREKVNSLIDERDDLEEDLESKEDVVEEQKTELQRLRNEKDELESEERELSENAVEKVQTLKQEAYEMAEEVEEKAEQKLESVRDVFKSFQEQTKQKMEALQDTHQEIAGDFESKLEDLEEEHREEIEEFKTKLNDVREESEKMIEESSVDVDGLREEFEQKLEEVREEAREMIRETEEEYSEAILSLYVDNVLHELDQEDNDALRAEFEKAKTIEQVNTIKDQLVRNEIAKRDKLPITVEEEVDRITESEEEESEVTRRLKGIQEKFQGNDFRTGKR